MKKNDRFQFVVYRENFLAKEECTKLRDALDTDKLVDANLAGDYTENLVNTNVRRTLNTTFNDENLSKKLNGAIKVANTQYFNYQIESLDKLIFLKYGVDSNYTWHTDIGAKKASLRKLTAIVQLSDKDEYDGGELEFGITNSTDCQCIDKQHCTAECKGDLVRARKSQGTLIIFPSFLSHRVTPITNGVRYSLVSWMEGDTYV